MTLVDLARHLRSYEDDKVRWKLVWEFMEEYRWEPAEAQIGLVRGVVADIFVVGGAAMAMAYDATRLTRDVGAMFVPHGIVLEEARAVAAELDLPPWWLNEQASVYVSWIDDSGRRRVFDHPGLRVSAASPEHIFAMKALAARPRDTEDLQTLSVLATVSTVDEAVRLCREFFPDEALSPRALAVLEELSG